MWSRTSSRVMRPPGPVPMMVSGSRPCSATRRRTTGESNRVSLPAAAAGAGGAGATGAGAGAGSGAGAAGAGAGSGASAAAGSGAGAAGAAVGGAGAGAAAPTLSPTTAITVPTSTVSPSATRISTSTPATGEGTSVSTLSVETSNNGSSAATASPTFLNHWVMVPSVTVSPSCGSVTSAICVRLPFCNQQGSSAHPLKSRPVSESIVSPNSSVRLGWGWMNSATSATVASQLTAR